MSSLLHVHSGNVLHTSHFFLLFFVPRLDLRYSISQDQLTVSSLLQAVDAENRVVLCQLLRLHIGEGVDGVETRVLCQRHGHRFQSVGKSPHSVLLYRGDLEPEWEIYILYSGHVKWE